MKKLLFMFLLFIITTGHSVFAADKTLTVHHVDQFGIPIETAQTFAGNENDQIILNSAVNNYFTVVSPGTSYTYTFTDESEQNYTFRYTNKRMAAPNSYFSMFFNTTYTYTGFVGAEYGGNLGYFNLVDDEKIRAVYTSSFDYTPTANKSIIFEIAFPAGEKFSLTDEMLPKLFVNDSGNQVLPLEMLNPNYSEGQLDPTSNGIAYEYWVSLDNKASYLPYSQLNSTQKTQVTNVIGRIFFSQNINYSGQRLFLTADMPISLNDSNLSNDELSGDVPISGWVYQTPDYTRGPVSLDTNIYLLNPIISGTVKINSTQDWDSGQLYENARIELIDVDSGNNENVIATTQTLADGSFSFHQEITSFNNIKIKVTDKEGYQSYFYYINPDSSSPTYLKTNNINVGNLPEMLPQTEKSIYSWYTMPGLNSFAQQSRSLKFLLVSDNSKPDLDKPDKEPDKKDNNGDDKKIPDAGNDINDIILLVMVGVLLSTFAVLNRFRKNNF